MKRSSAIILIRSEMYDFPYSYWLNDFDIDVQSIYRSGIRSESRNNDLGNIFSEDYNDLDSAVDIARRIARILPVSHVVSLSELEVVRSAKIREALNIDGQRSAGAILFRDKLLCRKRLEKHGIPQPRFTALRESDTYHSTSERLGPSVLIKPRRGSASKGIFFASELNQGAPLESHPALQAVGGWMAEEFIPGRKFHVDGIIHNGAIAFWVASEYAVAPLGFRQQLPGGSCIIDGDRSLSRRIKRFALRMLKAMPMKGVSSFHLDVFERECGDLCAGEIACRPAGNRILDAIKAWCGRDIRRDAVRVACGGAPTTQSTFATGTVGWFSFRSGPGHLEGQGSTPPFPWLKDVLVHTPVRARASASSIDNTLSGLITAPCRDAFLLRFDEANEWAKSMWRTT